MTWVKVPEDNLIYSTPCTEVEALVMLCVDTKTNEGIITRTVSYYSSRWGWSWRRTKSFIDTKTQQLERCYKRAEEVSRHKSVIGRHSQRHKNVTPQTRTNTASSYMSDIKTSQQNAEREIDSLESIEGVCSADATHPQTEEKETLSLRDIYRQKKAGNKL